MSNFPRQTVLQDPNSPPVNEKLHRKHQTMESILSKEYWQSLCPNLHVCDQSFQAKFNPLLIDEKAEETFIDRLDKDGYFEVNESLIKWNQVVSFEDLANSVVTLMQYGWPPSFLGIYDEAWAIVQQVSTILKKTTKNEMNMDFLVWYIDPNNKESGFSPHRDRQPSDTPSTFREDGTAMYTTCWIPFTDACPDNSCLYLIPRWADPGYFVGDDDNKDPLQVALPNKESYQNIRAIPLSKGSCVIFTHRIIHWGSRGRIGYHTPRIACSFAFSDDKFEHSYLSRDLLPYPDIQFRTALISAQMLIYYQRFSFSSQELSQFYQLYKSQQAHFHSSYFEKVEFEFVNSVKENTEKKPVKQKTKEVSSSEENEDLLDSALDAMLDARYGTFQDDFDEINSDDDFEQEEEDENESESNEESLLPPLKKQKKF